MKLIEIYSLLQTEQITEADAVKALGMTLTQFRSRVTKHGHRLPLVLSVLDKIGEGTITRDEAAKALGKTVRTVNKLSESWGVVKPIKGYLVSRASSKVKWEIRKKFAIDYIASGGDLLDVAERAGVTDRQMRRWISDLLKTHFNMTWKELQTLSDRNRRRLAVEIEEAEKLDQAKQNVINSIARGDNTLQNEALKRVLKAKRRAEHV